MRWEQLADLDEMVLRCRDEHAKRQIVEAVACYRAGAFRSCIVATWIAVVFDLIGKLRELDLAGDKNASTKIQEFEKIRQSADVKGALDFEKKVLDVAKDDFELLSTLEYDDIKRLLDDRNRCAHPSMVSADDTYQPSAELARCHLRNAMEHLLQHPPVQGKAALDRLMREVESPYFPAVAADAVRYFQAGPLVRPRDALVRNFVICLVKDFVQISTSPEKALRLAAALNATRQMHRLVFERTLDERMNDIFRTVNDSALDKEIWLLKQVSDTWQYLRDDGRGRLTYYVRQMPGGHLTEGLFPALDVRDLAFEASKRLETLDAKQLAELISLAPRVELIPPALRLYAESNTFNEANSNADRLIIPLAKLLGPSEVEALFRAVVENSQIRKSTLLHRVLHAVVLGTEMTAKKLDELIAASELAERDAALAETLTALLWEPP